MAFPPYHASGLIAGFQDSVWYNLTLFMPPSDRVLDASLVVQILQQTKIDGAMLLHIVEELASNPSFLGLASKLHYVMFAGAPINEAAGHCISARTRLISFYGSSEQTYPNILVNADQEDWPYLHFHPQANCFEFRPLVGGQGLSELRIHKDPRRRSHLFMLFPRAHRIRHQRYILKTPRFTETFIMEVGRTHRWSHCLGQCLETEPV